MEDADRLRQFLAGHNVLCPGCGYNLRDLQSNLCPECGRYLVTSELVRDRAKLDWLNALHLFSTGMIIILGLLSSMLVLNRPNGFDGFLPEVLLIYCFAAGFVEFAWVGNAIKSDLFWAFVFNPITYCVFYVAIAVLTTNVISSI